MHTPYRTKGADRVRNESVFVAVIADPSSFSKECFTSGDKTDDHSRLEATVADVVPPTSTSGPMGPETATNPFG